ncbi:putative thiolase-like protein [Rosellinia necatrix]|uniref:Putative thiolase-like protein n=1 Tax=Rosellinia necatrix TaxID=77044 RepID=A0A1W2TI05_ROSNE|nr:putative thiolase-like protein [Rosellinia necatrix]
MISSKILPSLLVFGPQNGFPSEEVLEDLRRELISNPYLSALTKAVAELSQLWRALVDFDENLLEVSGADYLDQLAHWVQEGGSFPHLQGCPPNLYALAVTFLLQISQYARYLRHLGSASHSQLLQSVGDAGIQGFCVGFITAIVVASSRTEADIGRAAAVGLRLAVCIGAYVDLDAIRSRDASGTSCVAVRWGESSPARKDDVDAIVRSYPDAYISTTNDKTCVTVTLGTSQLDDFKQEIRDRGLRATMVPVYGRFHTISNYDASNQLVKLSLQMGDLKFPGAEMLLAPVRSTVDGEFILEGALTRHIIDNTLLKRAGWYKTIGAAILQLPRSNMHIAFGGFGHHIPSSLVAAGSFQITYLQEQKEGITTNLDSRLPIENNLNEPNNMYEYPSHSIAIIGMAGRFPGADSLDEFWELILEGKTMVEPAPVERLRLPQDGNYADTKWWGNFLRDPEAFDHRFFKKSSREAIAWDPQQRILLEVAYEALESAGYFGPSSTPETDDYGCYIGAVMNNYYDNLTCHPATAYATLGTSRCFISGCISHYFGWTGPSLTIDTACSSSLVAINTACRAIWSGECSRAVAGGTNVISSPFDYQNLHAAGFLSPTGQCKPFDAAADGYCRGEGVGVVVLKKLSDAMKDNDNILGVIVGSAANQNHNLSHITVPHSGSQVTLYQKVMELGNVRPELVSYVEAHGTGTGVGDPVEVRSIRDAFGGPQRDSLLHFSSVKGNIGHTEATAGVAGLIKVLLMMRHSKIPKQANHNVLNPKIIPFHNDQMAIPQESLLWSPPTKLACVNSYGAAGSNSAVMICEKPFSSARAAPVQLSRFPLILSAASPNSLSVRSKKLLEWLMKVETSSVSRLGSLMFTLADQANHALPHVLTSSISSAKELKSKLEAASVGSGINTISTPNPIVLVFGGQESDFVGLSQDVYLSCEVFRNHLDCCDQILVSRGLESLYPAIFNPGTIESLAALHSALFAIQYASAMAWIDCGMKVDAVIGHSFGQLTALCIAGSLSLSDTLKLVVGRASLMREHWGPEPGSMVFLQTDRETVGGILQSLKAQNHDFYAEIACYNGPKSHVVVGSSRSITSLEQHITDTPYLRDTIHTKKLGVTHGFHSKFTESMLVHLAALAKDLDWRCTSLHLETCDEIESITEPDFTIISRHTRSPVFFNQAVERLTAKFPSITWVEAGRGSSVIQLVKNSVPDAHGHTFLSPQLTSHNAQGSLTDVTVDLWKQGQSVQFWSFHRSQKPAYQYLSLPPYQFEKTRHWLPYTSRESQKETGIKEAEEAYELISFLRFKDESKTEALFKVDPHSDRFQNMLSGHVMSGQMLAPASLYFELAARAALFLQNDPSAKVYVPAVDDLLMKSPIGHDKMMEITLMLKHLDDTRPSWSFSITTRGGLRQTAEPYEQSTGKVYLKTRDDAQAAKEFRRFESLTGCRRYDELYDHPDAEKMEGNHIYRAFSTVVHYGEAFRGIKKIACVRHEAAGTVIIMPDPTATGDQRLCDTPMTDSFMQFAGFLINYFNNPSLEDVFVCMNIEHIEMGGEFNPDAREWIVYSNMSEGSGNDALVDVYVFEAKSKKMVMAAFGFRFSKIPQALLAKILENINHAGTTNAKPRQLDTEARMVGSAAPILDVPFSSSRKSSRIQRDLLQILCNVTDVPIEDLNLDSTLDEFGIDSLMATEVLNDIRTNLGLNIDLTSFLFFPSIRALVTHVEQNLGVGSEGDEMDTPPSPSTDHSIADTSHPQEDGSALPVSPKTIDVPTIISAISAFKEIRLGYDQLAEGTGALDFWSEVHPYQARLVLGYVVESFARLGCDLRSLQPGDPVPQVTTLKKHTKLVSQLYRIIEDEKLVKSTNRGYTRSDVPIDEASAESVYWDIVGLYPQHDDVNKLIRSVGSQLAACLIGEQDGLQVVFGDRETKRTLESMYEFWPLLRTPTLLLGDALLKAFTNATGGGKFRILEVGGGTGGTTRYITSHLQNHGISFEYVFTDISSSLVAAAKKKFKAIEGMSFEVLDIEKPVKVEYKGFFHCIIATNCIHATRNLEVSLSHLREMLREDGALMLIEITKNMFWLDIVVGLFEGWWLFEDGRSHALVDENHWKRAMKNAGFGEVLWSDGTTPESRTVRVIGAFPSSKSSRAENTLRPKKSETTVLETVVYKRIGDQEIHADIYYPDEVSTPGKKMPVALMIHGGSHIIFSRKDIRPAQTRHLLKKGFVPVSLDHRLCPEVSLSEGPMVDVCDALHWARHTLPQISTGRPGLQIDGEKVVVVGWSSGGQLAMSLAWTAPQRGLRPPEAILAFYCPTNYEDEWWRHPIQPMGAEDKGVDYDVLEAVQDEPITNYGVVGAWEPLSDPRILTDPRCRIVLHINWKAQTLPVIIGGLPSREKAGNHSDVKDWNALPQPSLDEIVAVSPLAQIRRGNYQTPTFLVHGTADDLIPWQQSRDTHDAMVERHITSQLALVEGAPHICDLSSDPDSEGWKAAMRGYEFLSSYAF